MIDLKDKIKQRNKKFYTEKGLSALKERLKSWIKVYNEKELPYSARVLAFGTFTIKSKEELMGRIKELTELIGEKITIKREVIKSRDGSKVEQEVMYGRS